ncbi:lipase maturation factor family protein [Patescibacteria group bacterium AH-259-L07]|nr:lipase maturation factor family protein [Patescibacteria group bacterium AH-259-L07]
MKKITIPLLIYDGECGFCRIWIDYWKRLTGDKVTYEPFQKVGDQFPQIPPENFVKSVQLVTPEGKIYSGAEAVFRTLAGAGQKKWMVWSYKYIPGFAAISEWFYNVVAAHRSFFYKVTRLLWGKHLITPSYRRIRWLFLRLLGVIYFIAFISLGTQITGLVGSTGILPVDNFLQAVENNFGIERYWLFPTLAWLSASDIFLYLITFFGAILSIFIIVGMVAAPALFLVWILYLSLVVIGQVFLSFQWDIFLLEVGFLAMFIAPWRFKDHPTDKTHASTLIVWLYRLLLFRFIFSSGAVKLLSGDSLWRNLKALTVHYQTQPLPTPIGYYVHQLPVWFHEFSLIIMFGIQLIIPFLIFAPRRVRFVAAGSFVGLEALILLTGNYTFFNLLTIFLCLFLLDDQALHRWVPKTLYHRYRKTKEKKKTKKRITTIGVSTLIALIIFLNVVYIALPFVGYRRLAPPARYITKLFAPFHIVNSYGLFANMTNPRYEIIIEGSNDGKTWLVYEFKYKPGDIERAPPMVAPHQPRLDWQMWFAALSNYQNHPWFGHFLPRLLQGSPDVLKLLEYNPFPNAPPRFIRALIYEYGFTDLITKQATDAWWKRELQGQYFPTISLYPDDQTVSNGG